MIMALGAVIVIAVGSISFSDAIKSINFDVIVFLFFMFLLSEILEQSGFLYVMEYRFFNNAKSIDALLLTAIFSMAMLSYIFMNDTIAIIGTPLMLFISKKSGIPAKIMLLCLAFSITLGSVPSPIGNPQNLIIASSAGFREPFSVFAKYLLVPSIINLFAVFFVLKIIFKSDFERIGNMYNQKAKSVELKSDNKSKYIVLVLILFIIVWVLLRILFKDINIPLYFIPVIPSLYGLLISKKKTDIIKKIDYKTLIFFISMFILMKSLYLKHQPDILFESVKYIKNVPSTMAFSILISQIISNVPFATLFVDSVKNNATPEIYASLAAGSTIAGNLFILGAASNVIIIQRAERDNVSLSFIDFAKCGIILTLINYVIYYLFFLLV
jgi:Na+/H+ antiporter NhaD/arsenite permease-like protein